MDQTIVRPVAIKAERRFQSPVRDVIRCNRLWCESNAKPTQSRFCHQEMMIEQAGRSRTRGIDVLVEPRFPGIRSRP